MRCCVRAGLGFSCFPGRLVPVCATIEFYFVRVSLRGKRGDDSGTQGSGGDLASKYVDFIALPPERLPKKYQDKNIKILYDPIHCPFRYRTLGEKRELCCGRMAGCSPDPRRFRTGLNMGPVR